MRQEMVTDDADHEGSRTPASFPISAELYERARRVIPGGVTSAVRAGALPHPLYLERGAGPYVWDVDGNRYIDFVLGYGPLILGHAPAVLRTALVAQLEKGVTFGSQSRLEIEVAELVVELVPGAEQVVFSTTGTEAVASALRIARAATGREIVVRFEGHYHGWFDEMLIGPQRGAGTTGFAPGSEGIPAAAQKNMLVAPWNDLGAVRGILEARRGQVAAIILEPLLVNGGVIAANPGFLADLRTLADEHGAILIFDEVITGFRLAPGGAQELFGVRADLAIFGKAIGAGVPLSAVAGRKGLLDLVAAGRVVHNGTFNGNVLALAGVAATLRHLRDERATLFPRLSSIGDQLARGLRELGPPLVVRSLGPIVHTAFGEPAAVTSVRDREGGDRALHARFIGALLRHGVHATPRGLWYVSTAHGDDDIAATVAAARRALAEVL